MAKLSAKARAKLPTKDFAGPNRTYPIPDKKHVAIAAGLAAMHGHKGIAPKAKAIGQRKFGGKRG
jgi:hypothetical protein